MKMFQKYPFKLLDMPYAYDALEPFFKGETIRLVYEKCMKAHVDALNQAMEKEPELQSMNLTELLKHGDSLSRDGKNEILVHAGGFYNLTLWLAMMSPKEQPIFPGVAGLFGGEDVFRRKMKEAALSLEGNGFAWMVGWAAGGVKIIPLDEQENPFTFNCYPLLPLNMWEPVYSAEYGNDKEAYIDSWFHVINWENVVEHCKERGCSCSK